MNSPSMNDFFGFFWYHVINLRRFISQLQWNPGTRFYGFDNTWHSKTKFK